MNFRRQRRWLHIYPGFRFQKGLPSLGGIDNNVPRAEGYANTFGGARNAIVTTTKGPDGVVRFERHACSTPRPAHRRVHRRMGRRNEGTRVVQKPQLRHRRGASAGGHRFGRRRGGAAHPPSATSEGRGSGPPSRDSSLREGGPSIGLCYLREARRRSLRRRGPARE